MKANELRIGNWVKYFYPVMELDIPEYQVENGADIQVHDNHNVFQPIPLTEEWLVKFGMVKKMTVFEKEKNSMFAVKEWEGDYVIFWGDNRLPKVEPKYVHQLQNLYFALTGEELTIKI